ncbi:hypothetical protein BH11CYA1_BH11CYA1_13120 [soil metagenome]
MKSIFSLLLTGVIALSISSVPAQASNYGEKDNESTQDAHQFLTDTAMLPVRTAAVGASLVLGTPIAIMRCEANRLGQYADAVSTELNAKDGSAPLLLVSIPGQAMNLVGTLGEGLIKGGKNALGAWDKPFSEQSFSLD